METENVHISRINHGDTIVLRNGNTVTVDRQYIKHDKFMGVTLYGDSYNLGTILIKRIIKL